MHDPKAARVPLKRDRPHEKPHSIRFRLTNEELMELSHCADAEGVSVATYCRRKALAKDQNEGKR